MFKPIDCGHITGRSMHASQKLKVHRLCKAIHAVRAPCNGAKPRKSVDACLHIHSTGWSACDEAGGHVGNSRGVSNAMHPRSVCTKQGWWYERRHPRSVCARHAYNLFIYAYFFVFVTLLPMSVSPLPFFLLKAALQNFERKSLRLYSVNVYR